jgi:hypothetical protein
MDERGLDRIARLLAGWGPRRELLRLVAALPFASPTGILLGRDDTTAKKKHKRKHHKHKHKHKRKRRCDVCARGCPFRSIQAAIDAAAPGATIDICPGTYREDLTIAKDLTLVGAGDGRGARNSIVLGTGTKSVVRIDGDSTSVTLEKIRLTGGDSDTGGGLRTQNPNGTVELTGCTVSGNTALVGGGIDNSADMLTLIDTDITGNTAAALGGGIAGSGTLMLTNCRVSGNMSLDSAGGIYTELTTTLTACTVSDNMAPGWGGGILNEGSLNLINSEVSDNTVSASGANTSGRGGGIYNGGGATVRLDADSRVSRNTAGSMGGGVYNSAVGTVILATSANVSGNTPNNCAGSVPLCSG